LLILGIVGAIGVFEILVISFFGVELFSLLYGKTNEFSGTISKILVWSYALSFFVASFSAVFIAMNKIKYLSIWQVFYFVSILSLFLFQKLAFLDFLRIFVSIEVFCYIVSLGMMLYIVFDYERKLN
jgi:O-antigen/teichoic acid export membrane protein